MPKFRDVPIEPDRWEAVTPDELLEDLKSHTADGADEPDDPDYAGWWYTPLYIVDKALRSGLIPKMQPPLERARDLQRVVNQKLAPTGNKVMFKPTKRTVTTNKQDARLFLFQFVPDILDDQDLDVLGI